MLSEHRVPPKGLDTRELVRELARVQRVNAALVERVESATAFNGIDDSNSNYRHLAFCIFETAVAWRAKDRARAAATQRAVNDLADTLGELAKASRAAESAQQRLRNAIESINEGFAIFDLNDRLALCNQTYLDLWPSIGDKIVPGISYSDLVQLIGNAGTALQAVVAPRRRVFERLEQRNESAMTRVHALADGRWIQIDELRSSEGEIVVVCTDITRVKLEDAYQRAQELAEKSALLQATLDTIQAGVCVYDRNRHLTAWNSPFLRILGLENADIESISTHDKLLVEYFGRQEFSSLYKPTWLAEGAGIAVDLLSMAPDRTIEVRRALMPDGGMTISFDDVTYRVKAERTLYQLNEELELRVQERTADLEAVNEKLQREVKERVAAEAALVAAKGIAEQLNIDKTRFLAAISHDLLQPLNAARLFVTVLANRRISSMSRSLVVQASSALDSVEEMLEALLEISRLDAKAFHPHVVDVDLSALLQGMIMEFFPFAKQRGLALTANIDGYWVRSDAQVLRRILQNLISNALRYTKKGEVRISARLSRDHVLIEVRDSGPGIARKDRRLIFKEFCRLDSAKEVRGAGLGLAIVERAARMLGHPITLKSRLGEGSIFGVSVPIGSPSLGRSFGKGAEVNSSLGGLKILVIDNDAGSLRGLIALLAEWGCCVEAAADELDAFSAVDRFNHDLDIIIADYHLDGDLRGDELIGRLTAVLAVEVKSVIISADRDEALRNRLVAGGLHLVRKPIQPANLRSLLHFLTLGKREKARSR